MQNCQNYRLLIRSATNQNPPNSKLCPEHSLPWAKSKGRRVKTVAPARRSLRLKIHQTFSQLNKKAILMALPALRSPLGTKRGGRGKSLRQSRILFVVRNNNIRPDRSGGISSSACREHKADWKLCALSVLGGKINLPALEFRRRGSKKPLRPQRSLR
jgi:hypothetical protein